MSEWLNEIEELHKVRKNIDEQCSKAEFALKLERTLEKTKTDLQFMQERVLKLENNSEGIAEERKKDNDIKIAELNAQIARLRIYSREIEEQLKKVHNDSVKKNFNKYICLSNVRELLKDSTVKIGQIEKEANCQPGYMSRLEKKTNSTDPSLEFLIAAAKMLHVSLDILLFVDLKELNPTEKYLISFIQKLKKDTLEDKLNWSRESAAYLNRLNINADDKPKHPLFSVETFWEQGEGDCPEEITDNRFVSHSFDCNTYINGDCFFLRMKKNSILYIMNISKNVYNTNDTDAYAKEMWMYTSGMGKQFIISTKDTGQIAEQIELLYNVISKEVNHPNVEKEVKTVIDAFMCDDLGEDD